MHPDSVLVKTSTVLEAVTLLTPPGQRGLRAWLVLFLENMAPLEW